ncbi:response regulator [Lusitaniella coriacea LEGE 07157]|uniref:Response regulator n=1 Tax=Lusitaniella coriacea LEGE 07157 TaxID=945747 RepID=A0A8J7IX37_9CYAN|nr:response regulator [Lusitaniella coriacea]MBE9118468.1 response regulator [Lusitaniella coriacea LEGE 07157]
MDVGLSIPNYYARTTETPLVLAVDDDEDSLVLLACILESFGCYFMTVSSAEEALILSQKHPPNLVLLDIVMPKINGIELLCLLKQSLPQRQLSAIAITGLAMEKERKQIQQAGFNDCLTKPYLIEDLERLLLRHLDKKNDLKMLNF